MSNFPWMFECGQIERHILHPAVVVLQGLLNVTLRGDGKHQHFHGNIYSKPTEHDENPWLFPIGEWTAFMVNLPRLEGIRHQKWNIWVCPKIMVVLKPGIFPIILFSQQSYLRLWLYHVFIIYIYAPFLFPKPRPSDSVGKTRRKKTPMLFPKLRQTTAIIYIQWLPRTKGREVESYYIKWWYIMNYDCLVFLVGLRANPPVRPHNFLGIYKLRPPLHFTFNWEDQQGD